MAGSIDGELTEFRNVNDLPRVPEGHKRRFVEYGGLWFYEDISDNRYRVFDHSDLCLR